MRGQTTKRVVQAASKGCGSAGRQQRVGLDLLDCELQVVAECLRAVEVAVSPLFQAEATRANYRSNVLCSNSLSSALGRTKPGSIDMQGGGGLLRGCCAS